MKIIPRLTATLLHNQSCTTSNMRFLWPLVCAISLSMYHVSRTCVIRYHTDWAAERYKPSNIWTMTRMRFFFSPVREIRVQWNFLAWGELQRFGLLVCLLELSGFRFRFRLVVNQKRRVLPSFVVIAIYLYRWRPQTRCGSGAWHWSVSQYAYIYSDHTYDSPHVLTQHSEQNIQLQNVVI